MKFKIERASFRSPMGITGVSQNPDNEYEFLIEINTLEDLLSLKMECGEDLIIGSDFIRIYDDFNE